MKKYIKIFIAILIIVLICYFFVNKRSLLTEKKCSMSGNQYNDWIEYNDKKNNISFCLPKGSFVKIIKPDAKFIYQAIADSNDPISYLEISIPNLTTARVFFSQDPLYFDENNNKIFGLVYEMIDNTDFKDIKHFSYTSPEYGKHIPCVTVTTKKVNDKYFTIDGDAKDCSDISGIEREKDIYKKLLLITDSVHVIK